MTYQDYLDKSDEIDVSDWTAKEQEEFEKLIIEEIRVGREICPFAFDYLIEGVDYDYGEILEEHRHGWVLKELIIKISDSENYMATVLHHDDCGLEYDKQVLEPVELREIKIMKWVSKDEPVEKEKVFLVERFCRDTGHDVFEGVFSTFNGAKNYILGWADYNVEDAKEYGISKEVVDEAIRLREDIKKYYTNLKENDFEQSLFAHDFIITKTYLQN